MDVIQQRLVMDQVLQLQVDRPGQQQIAESNTQARQITERQSWSLQAQTDV